MRQLAAAKSLHSLPSWQQWRMLGNILSTKEQKLFRGAFAATVLGIFFLSIGALQEITMPVPSSGGNLVEGVVGYPQLINPLYALSNDVDQDLTALVFSGLLRFDPDQATFIPDLASSFSISEDGKVYTLTLRADAKWHDHEPVTLQDVLFTFQAIQDPAFGSPLFDAFSKVTLAAIDDQTFTFTLTEPYAAFPSLLTTGILPSHLWADIAPSNAKLAPLNIKPIGSGPYTFGKLSKDSRGSLRSVTLYSNQESYHQVPYMKEITVKFFPDIFSLTEAVKNKYVTSAAGLDITTAKILAQNDFTLQTPSLTQYVGAFFNTKRDVLAQAEVRKALALALDRSSITAHATQNMAQAITFGLPGFSSSPLTGADPVQAATLLDEAGWKLNEQGVRAKNTTTLSLTILSSHIPEYELLTEKMKETWSALGISVQVSTVDDATLLSLIKERNFDVLLTAERYGAIADPYPFWHSSQTSGSGLNITQFSSKVIDEAVTALRSSSNPETRTQAYTALTQEILAQTPAIFFYQSPFALLLPPRLTTSPLHSLSTPADRFAPIEAWYLKTKRILK